MSRSADNLSRVFDVVIVGGGPAGLSAALILGRSRRHVLLCDAGRPRNAASHELHGFLTRDGIAPSEIRRIGREQLAQFGTIEIREVEVVDAAPRDGGFILTLAGGGIVRSRKLLLATGVTDLLPQVRGFDSIYGRSAFHCPHCDGWEFRDRALGVYGPERRAFGLALELRNWSAQVTLCTDGPSELGAEERVQLEKLGILLCEDQVVALESSEGMVERVCFQGRPPLAVEALFFDVGEVQASTLVRRLGCEMTEKGAVITADDRTTNTPGLFVAGDACQGSQLAIIAAAEGAQAGIAINNFLIKEDHARVLPR